MTREHTGPMGNRIARLTAIVALGLLISCGLAARASATAYVHPFISAFGKKGTEQSVFANPMTVTVDQSNHVVYVGESEKVYRFTSTGTVDNFTEGPFAGTNRIDAVSAGQMAVAPAGSPGGTAGDLYIQSAPGIEIYSPVGTHIGSLDDSGNTNPDSGGDGCGVAVDPAGNVYVCYSGHIDKYVPSADPVASADFDSELSGVPIVSEPPLNSDNSGPIAVSSTSLYLRGRRFDLSLFPDGGGSADATGLGIPFGDQDFTDSNGRLVFEPPPVPAVDPLTEDLYLASAHRNGLEEEAGAYGYREGPEPFYFDGVHQFDKEGNLISHILVPDGPGATGVFRGGAFGVAVDGGSGNVYVPSFGAISNEYRVRIYGPGIPVNPPSASIDPVTSFNYQSAHFSGTVNAGGSGEAQETTYVFTCTPECPGLQGTRTAIADGTAHAVSDDTSGLQPETSYEVTLSATNANGVQTAKATTSFQTPAKPLIEPPEVTIDPAGELTATSAQLSGTIDPGGTEAEQQTTYRFEYSADGLKWIALADQGPITGSGPQEVSTELENLRPNTSYSVRLHAENGGGTTTSPGPNPSFTTLGSPPFAEATGATHVLSGSAQLNGRINPHGSQTSYYFQWGPNDCASGPCTSVPASEDADAGSGGDYVFVKATVEGLSPQGNYSYRLIAKSPEGEATSPSASFATTAAPSACANQGLRSEQGSSFLPDCRAWEMVSPRQKNGGGVGAAPDRSRAAIDGDAVSFGSFTAFAGTPGADDKGAEYVSRRGGPEGWSTYSASPQHQSPIFPSAFASSHYMGEFSADLSKGIFLSLTEIPGVTTQNVNNQSNLYLGSGLGSPTPSMTLVSDAASAIPGDQGSVNSGYTPNIELAGASADFSHVAFETPYNLTAEASGESPKAYEWANGTVRVAGILPDGACESPPCQAPTSVIGAGARAGAYTAPNNAISSDGARIFFTAGALSNSVSDAGLAGDLYLREDGTTTVQIDASERTQPIPGGLSTFEWATPDGASALFISNKPLVDEDQDGSGEDLYRYNVDAPAGQHLTLMTPEWLTPNALGISHVVGASEDGSIVYVIGAEIKGKGDHYEPMYVLHGDMVRQVGAREAVLGGITDWGDAGGFRASMARVSPDGRHVLFQSVNDQGLGYDNHHDNSIAGHECTLTPADLNQEGNGGLNVLEGLREGKGRCAELFLYSFDSGETVCVSCNPSGAPAEGNGSFETRYYGVSGGGQHLVQPMSTDGRRIFFNSRDALVPSDSNGKPDVYEYDSQSGDLRLISSGGCNCASILLAADADGSDAFFATKEQLVIHDEDNLYDVYDARIGGGIQSQNEPLAPGCEGDACQAAPTPPVDPTPSSVSFQGAGNVSEPRSQGRKHRKHAKKRKHRNGRRHRSAGGKGRTGK
jgi:hypothetical protein